MNSVREPGRSWQRVAATTNLQSTSPTPPAPASSSSTSPAHLRSAAASSELHVASWTISFIHRRRRGGGGGGGGESPPLPPPPPQVSCWGGGGGGGHRPPTLPTVYMMNSILQYCNIYPARVRSRGNLGIVSTNRRRKSY